MRTSTRHAIRDLRDAALSTLAAIGIGIVGSAFITFFLFFLGAYQHL